MGNVGKGFLRVVLTVVGRSVEISSTSTANSSTVSFPVMSAT